MDPIPSPHSPRTSDTSQDTGVIDLGGAAELTQGEGSALNENKRSPYN